MTFSGGMKWEKKKKMYYTKNFQTIWTRGFDQIFRLISGNIIFISDLLNGTVI